MPCAAPAMEKDDDEVIRSLELWTHSGLMPILSGPHGPTLAEIHQPNAAVIWVEARK